MALRDRFDRLTAKAIEAMPRQLAQESVHLDCKLLGKAELADDDKRNLARAISGFANSEGGIILWGVEAKRNNEGIDCVISSPGIAKVRLALSRLVELTPEAVDPPVDGVEHRAITRRAASRGFLATLVPPSDGGPHMAKLGLNRYYKRNGTSFLTMEHYDIADMFGRRQRPVLKIAWRVELGGGGPRIIVGLENTGRGAASAPFLSLRLDKGPFACSQWGLTGGGAEGMRRRPTPSRGYHTTYAEGADFVIHPGVLLDVMAFAMPSTPQARALLTEDVKIEFAFCANGVPLQKGTFIVPLKAVLYL
jgi:hypothetical protein